MSNKVSDDDFFSGKEINISEASKIGRFNGEGDLARSTDFTDLEATKENNRFFLEKYKNVVVAGFGLIMLIFMIWNSIVHNNKVNRLVNNIEQDKNITTAEKVELIDELNDDLFEKNNEIFLGTLGLIIGYLIGNNKK